MAASINNTNKTRCLENVENNTIIVFFYLRNITNTENGPYERHSIEKQHDAHGNIEEQYQC